MSKIAVIGAGPAGLMAAAAAAGRGHETILFEKNDKAGRKIYITGKGRCNVTNACDADRLMAGVARNGKFLYSAFNAFNNRDAMDMFERLGVRLVEERGERVFPKSGKASDITAALLKNSQKSGAIFMPQSKVLSIEAGESVSAVKLENGSSVSCDAAIICTGGITYPTTGSTGDGFMWAKELRHTVEKPIPALVPLVTEEKWPVLLQGLSLKNVGVTAKRKGKTIYSGFGEMLFTHFGVSGPLIIELSSRIAEEPRGVKIHIDLKPALDMDTLDKRLIKELGEAGKKQLGNSLTGLLPSKLIPVFKDMLDSRGISAGTRAVDITRAQRTEMAGLLKSLELTVSSSRGASEAIVTRGGISIKNINPSTMESKIVKGLYFAGEVIDVDGFTGGYNIQIALSTGFLAGSSC
ncbi:MAG: NAD(P)/FAD-dependent oxidoreductase [Christensenellales bacterium]